jgi:hypothetical protein
MCHNPAKIFKIEKVLLEKRLLCRFSYCNAGLPWAAKREILLLNVVIHLKDILLNLSTCKRTIGLYLLK